MITQLDEDAIRLVAQEFKVPFTETKRLLELMILRGYSYRGAAKEVWGTSKKKDKALRMKKRYLELAKTPPPQVKADEELARLKNQHDNIEQRLAEKEAAKNLADEKARLRKENLIGEVKLGGTKLILETVEGDPALYKRFIAYCELKGLTPERALSRLGCTTTEILEDLEFSYINLPWQQYLLESIHYLLTGEDEELPSMRTLEGKLYMRDHFPWRCPECGNGMIYPSGYTLEGERGSVIGCLSAKHLWAVKCPLCGSYMEVKTTTRWNALRFLSCPKCKEIWRRDMKGFQELSKKYCVRV